MPRFLAVVKLSPAALRDLTGSRQRFEQVRRYLARRNIRLNLTFRLDGAYHLFVLEAPGSPTRLLNRALAKAWPEPHERPEHARLMDAGPRPIDDGPQGGPQAAAVAEAVTLGAKDGSPVPAAQPSAARPASYRPSRRARSSLSSRSSRSSSSPR
ncbi:MAG TPA: hypothetical protein VFA46_08370 [Actinomycetes bacterium]|nr:hypothetical protein [Actinomycetes bacterium]